MEPIVGIAGNLGSGKDTVANMLAARGMLVVGFADEIKRLCEVVFEYERPTLWGASSLRNQPDPRWETPGYAAAVLDRFCVQRPRVEDLFREAPTPPSWDNILSNFRERVAVWDGLGAQASCRKVLQHMGTEWGRALWDEVWLAKVAATIRTVSGGEQAYTRTEGLVPRPAWWMGPFGFVIPDTRFSNEAAFNRRAMRAKNLWVDASVRAPVPSHLAHSSEPKRADFIVTSSVGGCDNDLIDYDVDNNGSLEELSSRVASLYGELVAP